MIASIIVSTCESVNKPTGNIQVSKPGRQTQYNITTALQHQQLTLHLTDALIHICSLIIIYILLLLLFFIPMVLSSQGLKTVTD